MITVRDIYYTLSPTLRFGARRLFYLPLDLYEAVCCKRGDMIPPRGMIFIGSGDFIKQGNHLMELVVKHAGLQPDGRILDVGCGIGRLAVPLTQYLNGGEYHGFDIVEKGIKWCNNRIASRFPQFHFLYTDLKNDLYNLSTNEEAKRFAFPYPAEYFDCIALTSVFTHMMPDDVDNYLSQIALVMKNGGKCLATFFILNPEVREQTEAGKIKFRFEYSYDGYSLMSKKVREANIAFDETYLLSLLRKNGLEAQSIHRGSWSGGESALDFQDVVVIRKSCQA